MSSTLPPNTAHGLIKWNYGLVSWRGVFSSAAISIRPTILKRACMTIWRSTIPITPIRIGGRIQDNPWCERHPLVALVVNNVMVGRGLAHNPNALNGSFIRPGLTNGSLHSITGSELMKRTSSYSELMAVVGFQSKNAAYKLVKRCVERDWL